MDLGLVPNAGLAAMAAASSLVLGAWIAERTHVAPQVLGRTMGFGAGALIAALAYDLIPDSNVSDVLIWVSFGAGAFLFYYLDGAVEARAGGLAGPGIAIALGALLDGIPESIVLGVGLAVGGSLSIGFFAAVFLSNVPESLSATAELRKHIRPSRIYLLWLSIVVASGVAAAFGYAAASQLSRVDGRYVQALAAGGVLAMLASSMMPEAFEQAGRRVSLSTALGFAVAAVLTTLE